MSGFKQGGSNPRHSAVSLLKDPGFFKKILALSDRLSFYYGLYPEERLDSLARFISFLHNTRGIAPAEIARVIEKAAEKITAESGGKPFFNKQFKDEVIQAIGASAFSSGKPEPEPPASRALDRILADPSLGPRIKALIPKFRFPDEAEPIRLTGAQELALFVGLHVVYGISPEAFVTVLEQEAAKSSEPITFDKGFWQNAFRLVFEKERPARNPLDAFRKMVEELDH